MIGFILKNWKLVIDILIVIALVIAFTFWDPFDIFQQSKLRQTANLLTSIRDIGQLVTAEYYGEVISSWKEFKLSEFPEDVITEHATDLFVELRNTLADPKNSKMEVKAIREKYDTLYSKLIAFVGLHYFPEKKLTKLYDAKHQSSPFERKILKKLKDEDANWKKRRDKNKEKSTLEKDDEFQDYLDSIPLYIGGFYNFYSSLFNQDLQAGELKKKNIVFIGRGWVKAGFDFGTFDESNFLYEKSIKTVHFYGLKAVILNEDINPWFIPQQKVKGFDLVDFSGDVNFVDSKEVKADCKKKLSEQAGTEILKQAQANGNEALRNFFSLLLNEPDLIVEFHTTPYDHFLELVGADSLITLNEANRIDSIYRKEVARIRKISSQDQKEKNRQALVHFIEKVKKISFFRHDYSFSYYSLTAAAILRDSFHLHVADIAALLTLRSKVAVSARDREMLTTKSVFNDSLWFQSGDFMREFNGTLDMLEREVLVAPGMTTVDSGWSDFISKKDSVFLKGIYLLDSIKGPNSKNIRFLNRAELGEKLILLTDLRYDTGYRRIDLGKMSISDSVRLESLIKDCQSKIIYNHTLRDLAISEREPIRKVLESRLKVGPVIQLRKRLLEVSNKLGLR